MPDISDRTKREVALAAKLETIFANARDAGPDLSWTAFRQAVSDTLREDLSALFVVVWFLLASDETKIGANPDAVVSLFFDVARPDRIASQLAETSKSQLATGSPPASVFTSSRASTIAVTEITATITAAEAAANASNAATTQRNERHPDRAGQPMTADEIERNLPFEDRAAPLRTSPNLLIYWVTAGDAAVCRICSPLNQLEYERWRERFPNGPPAHPNCRCFLSYGMTTDS